jgi:hypothetical protein
MSTFKETTREGKIQKIGEKPGASWFKPNSCCKGDIQKLLTTFLYPIGGTLCFPSFAKRSNTKCCKVSSSIPASSLWSLRSQKSVDCFGVVHGFLCMFSLHIAHPFAQLCTEFQCRGRGLHFPAFVSA